MRFNAHHGLYRKYREMKKILERKINGTCEVKVTPKEKCRNIGYRDKAKKFRLLSLRMGIAYMDLFLNKAKEGGER